MKKSLTNNILDLTITYTCKSDYLLLLLFICSFPFINYGQQFNQQGLYMLDPYSFNPAYGGLNNSLTITGNFRKQWSEIPGQPTSQYLSFHSPIHSISGGFGGQFTNETIGASRLTGGLATFNYFLPTPFLLSVCGGIGFISRALDATIITTPEGKYENGINHNDPHIPNIPTNSSNGVINLGIFSRFGSFEIGLSSYQTTYLGSSKNDSYHYRPYHHLILYSGYYYSINEDWSLSPTLLLKTDFVSLQSELDIHLYNKNIFGGIGFRGYNKSSIDAVKVIIGGRISERLLVSYNFESAIGAVKKYTGNTHEILLQYRIKTNFIQKPKEKIIYHPRM
ncbi:MAG: PorP/SprF family type IX secretion system membrane protein [Saprospiraceae bacterium]|nr:PorP/SprF family type IX secretion system membrane protein [Saprospiraceae bacterium]